MESSDQVHSAHFAHSHDFSIRMVEFHVLRTIECKTPLSQHYSHCKQDCEVRTQTHSVTDKEVALLLVWEETTRVGPFPVAMGTTPRKGTATGCQVSCWRKQPTQW